jgi:hypothetical protein
LKVKEHRQKKIEEKIPYVMDHSDRDHIEFMESLKPIVEYELEVESEKELEDEESKDFKRIKGVKDLTRRDKAALVSAGIRGVLTKMGEHVDS